MPSSSAMSCAEGESELRFRLRRLQSANLFWNSCHSHSAGNASTPTPLSTKSSSELGDSDGDSGCPTGVAGGERPAPIPNSTPTLTPTSMPSTPADCVCPLPLPLALAVVATRVIGEGTDADSELFSTTASEDAPSGGVGSCINMKPESSCRSGAGARVRDAADGVHCCCLGVPTIERPGESTTSPSFACRERIRGSDVGGESASEMVAQLSLSPSSRTPSSCSAVSEAINLSFSRVCLRNKSKSREREANENTNRVYCTLCTVRVYNTCNSISVIYLSSDRCNGE